MVKEEPYVPLLAYILFLACRNNTHSLRRAFNRLDESIQNIRVLPQNYEPIQTGQRFRPSFLARHNYPAATVELLPHNTGRRDNGYHA